MVMRRRLLGTAGALGAALALTVAATAGNGTPISPASANPLTLSVIGDVPYSEAQLAAFPAWVDAINRDPKVDLVVHGLPPTDQRLRTTHSSVCRSCVRSSSPTPA
jgi:hypothetical protein